MTRLIVKPVCEQNSHFLITNAVNIYVTNGGGGGGEFNRLHASVCVSVSVCLKGKNTHSLINARRFIFRGRRISHQGRS